tara:strand:- start:299 stop:4282 length:3984 start_codon:yes stop_codon:yes gene_type:complete
MSTFEFQGTGGIIEGNLGAANVNVNLDSALFFSGGDGSPDSEKNVVTMGDVDLITTGGMTISAWIKPETPTDTVHGATIIGKQINYNPNALGYGLYWRHSNNYIYFSIGDGSNGDRLEYNASALVDTWIHVAGTYNSSTKAMVLYVNGVSVDTGTATGVGDLTNSNILRMGGNGSEASNGGAYYKGYIADARIYTAVKDQSFVKKLAAKINVDDPNNDSNANMAGWWKSNDGSGSTIVDHHNVGTDYNGVYKRNNSAYSTDIWHFDEYSVDVYDGSDTRTTGTFTVTQGKVEGLALSCLTLDGNGDHVDLASSFTLSHDNSSVAVWVKKDNATGNEDTIIGQASDANQHWLKIGTAGNIILRDYPTDLACGNVITDTNWHHIVVTMSGDSNGAIYVDGVAQTLTSNAIVADPTFDVIGIRGTIDEFDGRLRDLKVFDYALSAEQAASLYSNTYPQTAKHEWKMDEGSGNSFTGGGTTAIASSQFGGNAALGDNNGTLDLDGTLTIAANGTLSAPRGNLQQGGTFLNQGVYIHNSGTIEFNHTTSVDVQNNSTTVDPVFNNMTVNLGGGHCEIMSSITVEGTFLNTSPSTKLRSSDRAVTLTMGTTTSAGTLTNNSIFSFTHNGTNASSLKGASSLYPIAVGGTDLNWDGSGKGGVSGGKVEIANIDYDPDFTTGGGGITVTLTGDCEFDAVTVSSGDTLDLNGQRAEFSGLLTATGDVDFDGSLVVLPDLSAGGSGNIDNETTADLIFTGGADDISMNMRGTYKTVFINNASNDYETTNSTSDWSNCATTLICGSKLTTANVMGCTNLTIPTGGTLDAQDDTLTVAGDFTTSGGLIGTSALTFDGTDDQVVIADDNSLDFTTAMTMECWVKTTDAEGTFVVKQGGYYRIETVSGKASFLIYTGSNKRVTGTSTVNDGKWHHIAATYDQTNMKIYVDGKLENTLAETGTISTSSTQLILGSEGSATYFTGSLDEIRLFNVAKTELQIRTDMFQGGTLASSTGLVARYKCDEGTGTSLEDSSSNTNTGTLSSAFWAGSGTFTQGTSTLTMSGSNKFINYNGGVEDIYNLNITGTITLKDLDGGGSSFRLNGDTFTCGSGATLSSNTTEPLRFLNGMDGGTVTFADPATNVANLNKILNSMTSPRSVNIPEVTIPRIQCSGSSTTVATGNHTITEELEVNSGTTYNANGNTIASRIVDINSGTLDLRNSTLNFSVSSSSDQLNMNSDSIMLSGNTTINGHSSASKTLCATSDNAAIEVVGTVKHLVLDAEADLTVIGAVIDCDVSATGANIRQFFHTLDTQQLLDADEAGDDDLRLEKPTLDNANELQTG